MLLVWRADEVRGSAPGVLGGCAAADSERVVGSFCYEIDTKADGCGQTLFVLRVSSPARRGSGSPSGASVVDSGSAMPARQTTQQPLAPELEPIAAAAADRLRAHADGNPDESDGAAAKGGRGRERGDRGQRIAHRNYRCRACRAAARSRRTGRRCSTAGNARRTSQAPSRRRIRARDPPRRAARPLPPRDRHRRRRRARNHKDHHRPDRRSPTPTAAKRGIDTTNRRRR